MMQKKTFLHSKLKIEDIEIYKALLLCNEMIFKRSLVVINLYEFGRYWL